MVLGCAAMFLGNWHSYYESIDDIIECLFKLGLRLIHGPANQEIIIPQSCKIKMLRIDTEIPILYNILLDVLASEPSVINCYEIRKCESADHVKLHRVFYLGCRLYFVKNISSNQKLCPNCSNEDTIRADYHKVKIQPPNEEEINIFNTYEQYLKCGNSPEQALNKLYDCFASNNNTISKDCQPPKSELKKLRESRRRFIKRKVKKFHMMLNINGWNNEFFETLNARTSSFSEDLTTKVIEFFESEQKK